MNADGGIAMGLLFRLLTPKAARTFRDYVWGFWALVSVFVGDVNLDRFQRWFWSTPEEQHQILQEYPALGEKIEALFVVFQQHMDAQHEVIDLRRHMLTLPALPDEGY
jgi:hypothetical protein